MNTIRYLTFEINRACPNKRAHKGSCPISHPDRYKHSTSNTELTDQIIFLFWAWCRTKGFRGIVLWHMYNEPTLVMDRILNIMRAMKSEDRHQPFQLTTSVPGQYPEFDIVKVSDYSNGGDFDRRIDTAEGEGRSYSFMPARGWCGRGRGWEIPIDNFGNWCLCCGDWKCEESIGNIHNVNWEKLYTKWKLQTDRIKWHDKATYEAMPRLCRACLDKNPMLSKRGGI